MPLRDGVAVDESPGYAIEQASEVTSSDVHLHPRKEISAPSRRRT